jgi:hypothetical protein
VNPVGSGSCLLVIYGISDVEASVSAAGYYIVLPEVNLKRRFDCLKCSWVMSYLPTKVAPEYAVRKAQEYQDGLKL